MKKSERELLASYSRANLISANERLRQRVVNLESAIDKLSQRVGNLELCKIFKKYEEECEENRKNPPVVPDVIFNNGKVISKEIYREVIKDDIPDVIKWFDIDISKLRGSGDEWDYQHGMHRPLLLLRKNGVIYTGRFYPASENHPVDCFSVDWIHDGFEGSEFHNINEFIKFAEYPYQRH